MLVFPAGSEIKIVLVQAASCGQNYSYAYFAPTGVGGSVRYRLAIAADTTSCPPNLTLTNGSCVDAQSNPQNCGASGNACATGQACRAGTCLGQACVSGQTVCSSYNGTVCTNTQTDFYNCGACGNSCYTYVSNGMATGCVAGRCGATCNSGLTACSSSLNLVCTNLATDSSNCGACGNPCAPGQTCQAGTCQNLTCSSGLTACKRLNGTSYNVTCLNTQTDSDNCGGCTRYCPSPSHLSGWKLPAGRHAAYAERHAFKRIGQQSLCLAASASGGTAPYTFSLASGSTLPSGLR